MRPPSGTKVVRRLRTKGVAQGTYKAFVQLKNYLQRVKKGYTKEVIVFQRKSLIKPWERHYDVSAVRN